MVPVTVNYKPFTGTIAVTGLLTGYVGDPGLTISESLHAVASDLTGLQVDHQVTWQAQELPSTGIQVFDNKITFTARGTFHVRAVVDGVYSLWVAVTALPKRRLASLAITDPVKVLKVTLTKGGSATVDLTQLPVVAKDQYGDPVDLASSTWVPTGTGLSVQGTTLTITAPGSYSHSLTSGAIRSNSLPVRATLVKRQLRFNTAGGTEVAPITVPDGKIVWLVNPRVNAGGGSGRILTSGSAWQGVIWTNQEVRGWDGMKIRVELLVEAPLYCDGLGVNDPMRCSSSNVRSGSQRSSRPVR